MPSVAREHAGTAVTLDAGALVANWRLLGARAGQAECAAVLKADGYGQGLERAANPLLRAGCRTFFVAHVFEGARLRQAAPDATVYILNGLVPGLARTYADAHLRPVLNSLSELAEWREALAGGRAPCALQVDSGMHRVGLATDDLREAKILSADLDVALLMSHFVRSGGASLSSGTARQVAIFDAMRAPWPNVPASLANSSGIFSEHHPHYDLVRPGYALFGGNPTPDQPNPMRPVVGMEASVLQVHAIAAGESVGYEACWTAASPRRLATIGCGYADGIPFGAGGRSGAEPCGWAEIAGVRCPFVGRVSMDLIVLDVTDAPPVARGDNVTLLGEAITVDDLAARAGTIGYEVLTKLGLRGHRRVVNG